MGPGDRGSKAKQTMSVVGAAIAIGLVAANAHLIFGLLSSVFTIGNTGVIASANIGVYGESQCVNNVTAIDWGAFTPGQSRNVTVYVKNKGSVALTLSLGTQNWVPTNANTYITPSWNYGGGQIQPNGVLQVTFTLTVSQSIQGISNFSFDLVITGTQGS